LHQQHWSDLKREGNLSFNEAPLHQRFGELRSDPRFADLVARTDANRLSKIRIMH